MQRYKVTGYTGPQADFTAIIDVAVDLADGMGGDYRYSDVYNAIKPKLMNSDCLADYLDVLDMCDFELREDLADKTGQIVWHAEAMGCDNCQGRDGDGCGDNYWTDGCNDEPHGGYLLTFDPITE